MDMLHTVMRSSMVMIYDVAAEFVVGHAAIHAKVMNVCSATSLGTRRA